MHRRIFFPPKDPPKKFLYTPSEKKTEKNKPAHFFFRDPSSFSPSHSLPPLELALWCLLARTDPKLDARSHPNEGVGRPVALVPMSE